jgi:protein CpxP
MPVPSQPETGTKHPTQGENMSISPEIREKVANELKQFVGNLNLSDEQQDKLRGFLGEAYEKVEEYRKQNPNATKEDLVRKVAENRNEIRERLTKFLTPEQLTKWDAEVSKAKQFLGQARAASA